MSNRLNIEKSSNNLSIFYKWYSLKAIFITFFTIIWCSFLFFWYSMTGDAPVFFQLFPIIHVSVGFFLAYLTVCLYVNTTSIEVTKLQLTIKHYPLPWFGAKTLDIKDVKQVFVREKINRGKKGSVTYTYDLFALLGTGKEIKVISGQWLDLDSDTSKEIEREIEQFLGIQDFQVAGEHQADYKKKENEVARSQKTHYDPIKLSLADLQKDFLVDYQQESWNVTYQIQYDWSFANTDRLLQLVNSNNVSTLVFLQKNMSVVNPWIVKEISLFDLAVSENNLPNSFNFQTKEYRKSKSLKGKMFVDSYGSEIKGELYLSVDERFMIMFFQDEKETTVYHGEKENTYNFENILPQ